MIEWIILDFAKEAILAPVLIYFMYQNKQQNEKMIVQVALSAGKTIFTKEQALEIGRAAVKAASIDKIDFIRRRIEKNNLINRRDSIQKSIKAELIRLSSIYINQLNQYNIEWKVMLWDWIWENFEMEAFLEEVYDSVFSDNTLLEKTIDIQTTMTAYQNQMWEDLRIYLHN